MHRFHVYISQLCGMLLSTRIHIIRVILFVLKEVVRQQIVMRQQYVQYEEVLVSSIPVLILQYSMYLDCILIAYGRLHFGKHHVHAY